MGSVQMCSNRYSIQMRFRIKASFRTEMKLLEKFSKQKWFVLHNRRFPRQTTFRFVTAHEETLMINLTMAEFHLASLVLCWFRGRTYGLARFTESSFSRVFYICDKGIENTHFFSRSKVNKDRSLPCL